MDSQEAIKRLKKLVISREQLWTAYKNKRSWSAAEKAMAIADVDQDIKAIEFAITVLES